MPCAFVVPTVLILVAAIHALPIMGVFAASKLAQLYGITVQDPNLELLLRHRAVLFGLLATRVRRQPMHGGLAL